MRPEDLKNLKRKRRPDGLPLLRVSGSVLPLLRFPGLERTGLVSHGCSTRVGGVSTEPHLATLNLSFAVGDAEENVRENFQLVAKEFGVKADRFVFTDQKHTANIRVVTEEDAGKGFTRKRDFSYIDGFVTNVPGLLLSVFSADCVPLLFVDPVNRAIGAAHSGWKGTADRIGAEVLRVMEEQYGTKPADVLCGIGPSICVDCYEVSEDVASVFRKRFPDSIDEMLFPGKEEGKAQLDLWAANRRILLDAGVREENIETTDLCTCCNPDLLFSHRASKGRRGSLATFLMLK